MKQHKHSEGRRLQFALAGAPGDGGVVPPGGFEAIKEDIRAALVDSQDFFPADFGNYGPLIVRLAWHCNGSYRRSDGRGGCDGARIRFDPEISWPDNGNLDNALLLLEPIKVKYGADLSWGDLIVLAGNTAIEFMGFPSLPFCGGRVDAGDGAESEALGPTPLQEQVAPCETQGLCEFPLGPTTVGLIYVNPAGPLGAFNDILGSANDVRNTFNNMGFNDSETVALVGGGHAFGKCHGACSDPPCTGLAPDGNPAVLTAGFEGAWTVEPTVWSNEYFNTLLTYNFTVVNSPAGQPQWIPTNGPDIIMLTADLALRDDPAYNFYVNTYASDLAALEDDFRASWYRLTTQDMGSADRCIGELVPDPQPFQQPLPAPTPTREEDYIFARFAIQAAIDNGTFRPDELIRLAFQCASTFRQTDFSGGCNGARIRFPPESTWAVNAGLDSVLSTFESEIPFRSVSFSDMIVLAGYTALEYAGGKTMPFCGGRSDATNAAFSELLAPRDYIASPVVAVRDNFAVMGLSATQGVALMGRPSDRFPAIGSLYASLANNEFGPADANGMLAPVGGGGPSVTQMEYALTQDTEYAAILQAFVDPAVFTTALADGWVQLMNADRFAGPTANACTGVNTPTSQPTWWPRISRDFVGTRLRRCARRFDTPPVAGTRCARRPKTCFFGTQTCPNDVGAHPVDRCFCDGEEGAQVWTCGPAACPATQFDPVS